VCLCVSLCRWCAAVSPEAMLQESREALRALPQSAIDEFLRLPEPDRTCEPGRTLLAVLGMVSEERVF
jgi:hypothetical protein